ncbi:MAG TPA: helix-turn-helix domain-containing protein [Thermoanaerobaculia bacterium]|nr:helix-turn-helix domain-containing protein [Thermoanaerobaculia bacterium]
MSESVITGASIGETLQRLRQARDLSLRTLASMSDFSPSFLSQIENGLTSPSIASLDRLARALGLTLADFFDEVAAAEAPVIVRAGDRKAVQSGWSRARFATLVPHGSLQRLDGILITLAPGGRSGKRAESLPYEQLALVTEGPVTLRFPWEEFPLLSGDAAAIPAGCPHQWENVSDAPATFAVLTVRRRGITDGSIATETRSRT